MRKLKTYRGAPIKLFDVAPPDVATVLDRAVRTEIERAAEKGQELDYVGAFEKVKQDKPALVARYAQPGRGSTGKT